jgi:hypothetical protein
MDHCMAFPGGEVLLGEIQIIRSRAIFINFITYSQKIVTALNR